MPRVLLVDDEPALLFTLSQLIKSHGLEPVLAHSAKEALTKLDGVDGVVTDYSMPDMDGIELVHAVHERDESLPVVVLTAHGSERIAALTSTSPSRSTSTSCRWSSTARWKPARCGWRTGG